MALSHLINAFRLSGQGGPFETGTQYCNGGPKLKFLHAHLYVYYDPLLINLLVYSTCTENLV